VPKRPLGPRGQLAERLAKWLSERGADHNPERDRDNCESHVADRLKSRLPIVGGQLS